MNARERALETAKKRHASKVNRGDQGARSFALTKAQAHDYFNARRNKKKLPHLKPKEDNHNTPYKQLSIDEYEKLYNNHES